MMDRWRGSADDTTDGLGQDIELGAVLGGLDPEHLDPNYWLRFRMWVLENAAGELARRRLLSELTVGDVMASWARAVVPTAMLAAALAGLLLVRGSTMPDGHTVSIEDLVVAELETPSVPPSLLTAEASAAFLFVDGAY